MSGIDSDESGSAYRGGLIWVHVKIILFTLLTYDACKSQNNSTFLQPLTWKIVITADKEVSCNNNNRLDFTKPFYQFRYFWVSHLRFVINLEKKIDLLLD